VEKLGFGSVETESPGVDDVSASEVVCVWKALVYEGLKVCVDSNLLRVECLDPSGV